KPSRPTPAEREEMARLLPVPAAERDLPGRRHKLLKDHVMREIRYTTPEPSLHAARQAADRRKQRKRLAWRLGLPAAVLTAAAGSVAAMVINTDPAPAAAPTTVACAHELTRDAGAFVVDIQDGETPEQACVNRAKTIANDLKNHPPRTQNTRGTEKNAPRSKATMAPYVHKYLVSCTSPTGDLGLTVYPRPAGMTDEQACTSVGQVRPDDNPVYAGASAAQIRKLQNLIDSRLGAEGRARPGDGCASYTATRAAIKAALDELGMDRWRIDDQRTSRSDSADVWYHIDESTGSVALRSGDDAGHCTGPTTQPTGTAQ
ncbi:hypothetical protein ACFYW6_38765, partial [Streptomyces sp. NPDC002659]